MDYNSSASEEEHSSVHKDIEKRFGINHRFFNKVGIFVCKKCGAPLFHSADRYESDNKGPFFDDTITNSVSPVIDKNKPNKRIVCTHCAYKLGYLSVNEHCTRKEKRYSVNLSAVRFIEIKYHL